MLRTREKQVFCALRSGCGDMTPNYYKVRKITQLRVAEACGVKKKK